MEDLKNIENCLDIVEKVWLKKRRVTCGNDTDFITIDYLSLMAFRELLKREGEENKQLRQNKEEAIRYIKHEWFKREQLGINDKHFDKWQVDKLLSILEQEV